MKSAAFNLAFKVHRSELAFPEGLLKAVEADAQEDYIEALNSLAGETRYDIGKLDQMVEEAKRGVTEDVNKPKVDIEKLKNQLEDLRQKRTDLKESIRTIESQRSHLRTTIIPGINSFLLFIVGVIVFLLLFLLEIKIFSIVVALGTLAGAVALLVQDMNVYNKQLSDIAAKKERAQEEINKITFQLEEINNQIMDLKQQIQVAESQQPTQADSIPQRPSPPKYDPDSSELPPLLSLEQEFLPPRRGDDPQSLP